MISTRTGYELESATYLQETETHRFEYDHEQTRPSMAVVSALSEVTETEPMALGPLQKCLDADALDTLVRTGGTTSGPVQVEFPYEGHTVTIPSNGVVEISPPGDGRFGEGGHR